MQDIIIEEYLKNALVPITDKVRNLVRVLFEQCYELPESVANLRPSYRNFLMVSNWRGDPVNAHIASLSALNSQHGCFSAAFKFIEEHYSFPASWVKEKASELISNNIIIHGFGNPVIKGKDDRCLKIQEAFNEAFKGPIANRANSYIDAINSAFFDSTGTGSIQENLVFWNSFVAYHLGLSIYHASLIFILATQVRYVNEITKFNKEIN